MTTHPESYVDERTQDFKDDLLEEIKNLDWEKEDGTAVREAAQLIHEMGKDGDHKNDDDMHEDLADLLMEVPLDHRIEVIANIPGDLREKMLDKMPEHVQDMVSALNSQAETASRDSAYSSVEWGRTTDQEEDPAQPSNDWSQSAGASEFEQDPSPGEATDFTEEKPDRATQFLSAVKDPASHPEEIRQMIADQAQGDRTDYLHANGRLMGEMRGLQQRRKITPEEYLGAREEFVKICREMTEEKRQEELQVKNPETWQAQPDVPEESDALDPGTGFKTDPEPDLEPEPKTEHSTEFKPDHELEFTQETPTDSAASIMKMLRDPAEDSVEEIKQMVMDQSQSNDIGYREATGHVIQAMREIEASGQCTHDERMEASMILADITNNMTRENSGARGIEYQTLEEMMRLYEEENMQKEKESMAGKFTRGLFGRRNNRAAG